MLHLGIDLGGTKIEGVILDASYAVLHRERIPTEAESGYPHILARVAALHTRLAKIGVDLQPSVASRGHTLGIGTPGAPSHRTGLLRNSNTQALNGRPVRTDLAAILGRPVRIENDANCFALAEALLGAARNHRVVFGVIMGTGCGGGLVIDGSLHVGRQAIGGEWGHMSIDPAGPMCYCGQRGCVETYISGSGLEARFLEAHGERRSAASILTSASVGDDARCVAALDALLAWYGRAMANLIDVLDPDIVVLGGGLSNVDALYSRGRVEVGLRVFCDGFDTPIVRNQLGDSAGVIGAALLGAQPPR